jgi:hypothetical protein
LGRDWDYRLNYLGEGIKLEPATDPQGGPVSGPYWKLVQARWLDDKEAGGASHIFVKALDADGNPLENAAFIVGRPDAQDPVVTKGPIDHYWGNYTMYALLGTYYVDMTEGGHPSERVTNVGLGTEEVPDAWTNTAFRFTFQLVEGEEIEVPPEPPEPERPPEPEVPVPEQELAELHQALREAAQEHIIPLDSDAPLYQYARQHDLGQRLSAEFTCDHKGVEYTVQAFEKGMVYAPTSQWDQVTHAENEG